MVGGVYGIVEVSGWMSDTRGVEDVCEGRVAGVGRMCY